MLRQESVNFANTYFNDSQTHNTIMRKACFFTFSLLAAVVAMSSCSGDNSMPGGRSKAEYERLKAVADSVDMQSPRARELVDSALTHTSDSLIYYDYFIELSRLFLVQQPDSVLQCTDRIMAFANSQQSTPRTRGLLAEAHHLRANYYYLYHQNNDKALGDNLNAYRLFLQSDMQENAADICANIGDVYMQQSRLPEAASWYRRALVITDSLQLPETSNYTFYLGLGRIYCILQDYKLSEEYYDKARKGFDKMHANMKVYFLNNYGNLKYYQQDYTAALATFTSLDSLIDCYGLKGGFDDQLCRLNMADVLLNLGRHQESMSLLEPADSFFRANEVGDAIYYANTIRMGNALNQGDIDTVRQIIANEPPALTTDEDMINIRERYLHNYYVKTGNLMRAIEMERAYNQRKDSIDESREHMRAIDIMTRLELDTLTLHNQVRLNQKNSEIIRDRLIYTLIIGGVLLVTLLLLLWSLYLRKRNVDKQLEILNLKISNNRTVLAPHFIFNVLKRASMQQGKESDKTIEGIIQLMRKQIDVSRKMFVTLREELEFTEQYVQLAAVSFGNDFVFTLNKPEEKFLDSRMMPSTFIQILAENAIKHALAQVKGEKRLTINAVATDEATIFTVEDNGSGFDIRSSAKGTGTGLSVISRTLMLHNEYHRRKINFSIENLTDVEGKIIGCQARLVVPADLE